MTPILRFNGAVKRDPAIDVWLNAQPVALGSMARRWFARMRECGDDVRELIHDGCPVACVEDAPFGYVNVFRAHANVASSREPSSSIPGACWQAAASTCGT